MLIQRQEQIDDRWYAWVVTDGLNCQMFEDDHEITEDEAQVKLDDWIKAQEAANGTTE